MQLVLDAAPRLKTLRTALDFSHHLDELQKSTLSRCASQYSTADWLVSPEVNAAVCMKLCDVMQTASGCEHGLLCRYVLKAVMQMAMPMLWTTVMPAS